MSTYPSQTHLNRNLYLVNVEIPINFFINVGFSEIFMANFLKSHIEIFNFKIFQKFQKFLKIMYAKSFSRMCSF